jgi:hypothetical protein
LELGVVSQKYNKPCKRSIPFSTFLSKQIKTKGTPVRGVNHHRKKMKNEAAG